ncbi:inositol polyphosphate kinase [Mycena galopus ATCC 62051]|nr:inositol polyphosphate kinase [Mycena galopus ATCC 62051]
MIKTAETTTTLKTGMRLTGFQVYNNLTGEAVHTSKAYGKSISAAQLPEGLARFFPIATAEAPAQGLPAALLLQILELLREDVQDIYDTFAALEIRMVGGSLLILYESDAPPKRYTPYDVRLIDFAHTRFVPGQGPDEGVLLGFRTILALLDERIAVVGACV